MIVNKDNIKEIDFNKGAMLLVDKPKDWTSFDVVNKLRFRLRHKTGVKKIKVGHAGTLDPMATGLLIICTGKMTKQIDGFQAQQKRYSGTIKLGATTDSYDAESEENTQYGTSHITEHMITALAGDFIGLQEQMPPIYSALKINGQAAYKLARRGEKVELKPRAIEILDFRITHIEMPFIHFDITCSKGTYIRSIAHDFGQRLNSGGYLTALRRDAIGEYPLNEAWDLIELTSCLEE